MENNIIVEFIYSEKVALQASVEVSKSTNIMYTITPIIGFLSLVFLITTWIQLGIISSGGFMMLIFSFIIALKPFLVSLQVKSNFKKSPHANTIAKYIFHNEGIEVYTEGTSGKYDWNKIYKVTRNKKGMLIFPQPRLAHWIPSSEYDNKVSQIEEILQSNNVKYIKKK
jgi:hypothetical protein